MRVHRDWLLTPERFIVHLPTCTAVVADLHLGYRSARRAAGDAVPASAVDTAAILTAGLQKYQVQSMIAAGDVVENRSGLPQLRALDQALAGAGIELTAVVPGNHDRGLAERSNGLPVVSERFGIAGWQIMHGDLGLPAFRTVVGHFHPCIRWGRFRAPCYLVGPRHIVLPAWSRDAAGVNVLGNPQWHGFGCFPIVGTEVLDGGPLALLRSRSRVRRVR